MAEGIRLVTVRRGVDPSGFALLSFGGAAGAHVVAIARQLGLKRVIVPRLAPVFSAWGMLATVVAARAGADACRRRARIDARNPANSSSPTWRRRGRSPSSDFDGRTEIQRRADMRYGEQIFEIDVPLDSIDFDPRRPRRAGDRVLPPAARGAFHLRAA